jgi:hypothetical protein
MLRDSGQIGRSAYTGFRHSLEVWPAVPHLPHVSKARGLHGEVSDGFQIAVAAALAEPAIASFPPLCPAVLQSVRKFEQFPLLVRCVTETQCVQIGQKIIIIVAEVVHTRGGRFFRTFLCDCGGDAPSPEDTSG